MRLLLVISLCLFVFPSFVHADYLSSLKRGKKLAAKGEHLKAIEAFNQALRHQDKPGALYYKALSFQALGRLQAALKLLHKVYNDKRTPVPVKEKIPARMKTLRQKLSGVLIITCPDVESATVLLNGKKVGKTPLTLKVEPGTALVRVEKPGYGAKEIRVTMAPRGKRTLAVELKKIPGRLKIVVKGGDADIFLDGRKVGRTTVTLERPPGKYFLMVRRKGYTTWEEPVQFKAGHSLKKSVTLSKIPFKLGTYGIISAVTGPIGIACLVGAGVTHAFAVKNRNQADDGTTIHKIAQDKINTSDTQIKIAWVLYGIGGAAVITSIVFLVLEIQHQNKVKRERLADFPLRLNIHPNGASVMMRF